MNIGHKTEKCILPSPIFQPDGSDGGGVWPQPGFSCSDWFRDGEVNRLGAPPGGTEDQLELRPLLKSPWTYERLRV